MAENAFGDFFLGDSDDEQLDDDGAVAGTPVVILTPAAQPETPVAVASAVKPSTSHPVPSASAAAPQPRKATREELLERVLNRLMDGSPEIQAAALVSLDGFTMASALPEGMQEDRVGAMSAAILGLGERAATELGKGRLTQVFIEGEGGYVMLIAAGNRSVLTCLADIEAKLGLVLYDMREAASSIAQILG
jgi:hypothetical protein